MVLQNSDFERYIEAALGFRIITIFITNQNESCLSNIALIFFHNQLDISDNNIKKANMIYSDCKIANLQIWD